MTPTLPEIFKTIPFAHRAFHNRAQGLPENSIGAIKAAIANGYGIEIDVQPASDGIAMVFHDYDLARLTQEKGAIHQRTADQLGKIVLRGTSETIPTLSQVLDIVAGQVPLLIEIKDQHGAMGPTDGKLEAATAACLVKYDGPVAIMSFNPYSVLEMAKLAPNVPRGITTSAYRKRDWGLLATKTRARLRNIPDYDTSKCSFISHEASDLGRRRVAELKKKGAVILCWTIRSQLAESDARSIADNVTFEGYPAHIPR
jgi:glycerophosphoryl diester phosphodiesterase